MRTITVEDLSAPGLEDFAKLTDVVLRRLQEPAGGLYIAESSKVISRAIAAGHTPRSFLVLEKWLPEVKALAERFDVPVYVGDDSVLTALTGFSLHRGALASMHRPPLAPVEEIIANARRIVILEDLFDHTNVGAIFRNCAALGADAVLVSPRCADPFYRRSVRVSMGSVLQVPWTRMPEWAEARSVLTGAGFHVAALALTDGAVSLDDFAKVVPDRLALVLGTEGHGLTREAIAAADTVVTIPMSHGVDSLNVAAASAVAMWELRVRQPDSVSAPPSRTA